jgi:Leucine-rich repeat (LRR) protein
MNFWDKCTEFLVSTVGQSAVDAWKQNSAIYADILNLRAALLKSRLLIERCECWRLPNYNPIDELLPQIKDAVYEAECVIDELEYQGLKLKAEKNSPGAYFINYLINLRSGLPSKVKEVQNYLDYVCSQLEGICNNLGIPENHSQFSRIARPITGTFVDTSIVYGRDKELNDIVRLLGVPRSGSEGKKRAKQKNMSDFDTRKGNLSVLSILGMGGVGKTTFAQMVCNNESVESHFDLIMWVCVSDKFDLVRLTKEIIESATTNECHLTNLHSLQLTLKETVKSKRFLLVLDDVWTKNWELLLEPMKEGSEGSVVIVTTRHPEFVEIAGTSMDSRGVINFEGLEEHIYWSFFKKCAFSWEANSSNYPELEEIGKEIAVKLRGSPLAAKTIGGLLRTNLDVGYWKNIKNSKMWQLQKEEHDILPVIQLSYQYLPSQLKKCFSFCSLYPKAFKFTKKGLKNFWIMQGFIKPHENLQQQEVLAEIYFHELESRGFFQNVNNSNSLYVIDDLMHDVCQSLMKDECFCIDNENFVEQVSLDIRHVSVFREKLELDKQMKLCNNIKLFSLSIAYPTSCCPTAIESWCNKLINIRSLSLAKCKIKKLPESFGNLKHLRYVDISFTDIEALPESFCVLYNLRYLNMECCSKIRRFPEGSHKLLHLQLFYLPVQKFSLIGHMENLAIAIQLDNLHFSIRNYNKIGTLKHMNKLRGSLNIDQLEKVPNKEAAGGAQLRNKPLINNLILSWSQTRNHTDDQLKLIEQHDEVVLEGLCPHPNLKTLQIKYYGGKNLSPTWLKEEFCPNLTGVHIEHAVNDFTISHLPHFITKLSIQFCNQLTDLRNCLDPNNLPALKQLNIFCCTELVSLPVESFGGFISLEWLTIYFCPKLNYPNAMVLPPSVKRLELRSCGELEKSIPCCLRNLTNLQALHISECSHLVSIPAEVMSNLKSLELLHVKDCAELRSLGGLQFLASPQQLNVKNCPKLEEIGGRDVFGKLPSGNLSLIIIVCHFLVPKFIVSCVSISIFFLISKGNSTLSSGRKTYLLFFENNSHLV